MRNLTIKNAKVTIYTSHEFSSKASSIRNIKRTVTVEDGAASIKLDGVIVNVEQAEFNGQVVKGEFYIDLAI